MVAVSLAQIPVFSFQINGVPATAARLFIYTAGTTTKIITYVDSTGTTQASNPIVMNARGEPQNASLASVGIWIPPGTAFKMVFAPPGSDDPPSTPIWTVDNLSTPATGSNVTSISFGSTGLTPSTGTSGNVTVAGTLVVANGGTGAATLTGLVVGNGASAFTTVAAPAGTVVGTSDTQTLTNKRLTPRPITVATGATITPTSDTADVYEVSALAVNAAIAAPTGTPTDGQPLTIRITDNGSAHTLSWNAVYNDLASQLPASSKGSTTNAAYVGLRWNSAISKWDVLASI